MSHRKHESPRFVDAIIWTVASVAGLVFALIFAIWFTNLFSVDASPQTVNTTGACKTGTAQVAINNYPGLSVVEQAKTTYKHAAFEDAMGGNYRCSTICVPGIDASESLTSAKNTKVINDYLKDVKINGSPVNIVGTGEDFAKLLTSEQGKSKMANSVILSSTKKVCVGYSVAGGKGQSVDYTNITKGTDAITPVVKNNTVAEAQQASTSTATEAAAKPADGGGQEPLKAPTSKQNDQATTDTTANTTPGKITIQGNVAYSKDTQEIPYSIHVIAAYHPAAGQGDQLICASATTNASTYQIKMDLPNSQWQKNYFNKNDSSISLYSYAAPDLTSNSKDYRNGTATISFNKASLGSVNNKGMTVQAPDIILSNAEINTVWDKFASLTQIKTQTHVDKYCNDNLSKTEQAIRDQQQKDAEANKIAQIQLTKDAREKGNTTFLVKFKAYYGFNQSFQKTFKLKYCLALSDSASPGAQIIKCYERSDLSTGQDLTLVMQVPNKDIYEQNMNLYSSLTMIMYGERTTGLNRNSVHWVSLPQDGHLSYVSGDSTKLNRYYKIDLTSLPMTMGKNNTERQGTDGKGLNYVPGALKTANKGNFNDYVSYFNKYTGNATFIK